MTEPDHSRESARYQISLRRLFLYIHIVAVACSAFVGISQILAGYDEDFRILLTAITIALASVCGLACGRLWRASGLDFFLELGSA